MRLRATILLLTGMLAACASEPPAPTKVVTTDAREVVAVVDGQVVGCGALHVVWADLAEIRSLAVTQDWLGMGVGRKIMEALIEEARSLGLPSVFALTYRQDFFERMGFHVVPRETLPHKIWGECLDCPQFPNCNEVAMTIDITQKEVLEHEG